jgi:glyoxylase-like metal-dependent hydrolase (beta-lactamase superfamily II)
MRCHHIRFSILFCVCYLFVSCSHADNDFTLYAVRYGVSEFSARYVFYGEKSDRSIPFAWMFYVIRYKSRIILVDTGYRDNYYTNAFSVEWRDPLSILKELDVTPGDVTDVIITHSHFDHIGNVDLFPDATIYIQEKELERVMDQERMGNIAHMLATSSSIVSFSDEFIIGNQFRIKKIGGHTPGSSVVLFTYRGRNYSITGDECYVKSNFTENIPVGIVFDVEKNREFITSAHKHNAVLFTMHDPTLIETGRYWAQLLP